MGAAGISVVLAVYWLTGAVGAASLPPGDQYSPYQPPYRRNVARGPLSDLNWLKYQQDLTAKLELPAYIPEEGGPDVNYIPRSPISRKKSAIPGSDVFHSASAGWDTGRPGDVAKSSDRSDVPGFGVPQYSKSVSGPNDDDFVGEDSFQDQGPGSVEIYKLDLSQDSSLLVPQADGHRIELGSGIKSKIPKKAVAEKIVWKLQSMEAEKASLPSVFRKPSTLKDSMVSRKSNPRTKDESRDEAFAVGGVPELQVGCEGLESADRRKRSTGGADVESDSEGDWDDSQEYQDPVYRESTEPILLRVTPIVLDIEDEDPPSGQVYEEMDELLKLKKLESTSPRPTTRRSNRADIDPAVEADKHQTEQTSVETFPERGDLGPKSNGTDSEVKASVPQENLSAPQENTKHLSEPAEERVRRDTTGVDSLVSDGTKVADGKDSLAAAWRTPNSEHPRGRRLLWAQDRARDEDEPVNHQGSNRADPDLWGFGEDDGASSGSEDEADRLRQAEVEKRRREYERRYQEELNRRLGGPGRGHLPHGQNPVPQDRDVNTEIQRIREEYERQLERERRERQRVEEARREWKRRHGGESNPGRPEDTGRRQEEESRRRSEEDQRRREWNRRLEEEERRRRPGHDRNYDDPSTSPVRLESSDSQHSPRHQQDRENEARKLRDHADRNRPVDPKRSGGPGPVDGPRRHLDERRREEERRRQLAEHEERQPDDAMENRRRLEWQNERRRQMEEQRRQREWQEQERRRADGEPRRRDRPGSGATEEERKRRLEEERKLQDYVRRNQPVVVPRRDDARVSNRSQESHLEEQRRTMEAARRWDRDRRPVARTNDGRARGPSAPANIGRRPSQDDPEDIRRRQQRLEEDRRREIHRRRLEEEERRREVEYQRAESLRREEERKRMEEAVRRQEESGRRRPEGRGNSWQDYRSSRPPHGETPNLEAEELRRRESTGRTTDSNGRKQEEEWRRRSEERDRQQRHREEMERRRLEHERDSRRRRPHHQDTRLNPSQRGESVRGGYGEAGWRRREHARLDALPVSARIILRPDDSSRNGSRTSNGATSSTALQLSGPSFGSRANFDNDIGFPGLAPNRPGLTVPRFPSPATSRPPAKSPGACVWAIVQCCPANNRLTTCFESMGCPGVNWDANPCRSSLADAARAEVVKFYEAANEGNARF